MNHAQIKQLASYYDEVLEKNNGADSVNHADRLDFVISDRYCNDNILLEHARWMCGKIQGMDDLGKMNRWIGFIQCILMQTDVFHLDELRMHTSQGGES